MDKSVFNGSSIAARIYMRRKIELGKMYTMKQNSSWWSSMGIPSKELKPGLNAGANIVLLDKVKKSWSAANKRGYEYKVLGPTGMVGWICSDEYIK